MGEKFISKGRSPAHKGAGHRERLRERFLNSGLDGFHDYEVIELLLTLGTPRKDCKGPAKAALKRFKTLQGVFEASSRKLLPKRYRDIDEQELIHRIHDLRLRMKL
jgi:DNA repair protein RadC